MEPYLELEENDHIMSILAARLMDHANSLRNLVKNIDTLESVPGHHDCKFGKWVDGNKEALSKAHSFNRLYNHHRDFHADANVLVRETTIANAEKLISSAENVLESFMALSKEAHLIKL